MFRSMLSDFVSNTKTLRLLHFSEIIAAYCEKNYAKHINTQCVGRVDIIKFEALSAFNTVLLKI
jgi:hypothetical protein